MTGTKQDALAAKALAWMEHTVWTLAVILVVCLALQLGLSS